MAASWAQYQAQDALIKTCEKAGIELTSLTVAAVYWSVRRTCSCGAAVTTARKPERWPARD
ncbi:hypothetical protein ACLB1Q_19765 [Escherichia coli]